MRVRHYFLSFLLFLFLVFKSAISFGSHIYGGELLYKNVSGNTYVLTLTLYGDCSANATTFAGLYNSTPFVTVYNGSSTFSTRKLLIRESGTEVSPVCPAQLSNTTCSGGSLPGVKRFVYSDTIELPVTSANWRFVFAGKLDSAGSGAGRSSQISNFNNGGTSLMQLEATLNNLAGPNSSPEYTTIPTPFYCINVEGQYNQGAVDANGDSLVFSLVPGKDAATGGTSVNYISPLTAEIPTINEPGAFVFNQINGQLTFTPSAIQKALVVNQVSEYRNGVLIGTSVREMTFIVTDNCQGTPPKLSVVNVAGGSVTGQNIINICVGTPRLTFDISVSNPDNDNTDITTESVPSGASLTVNNNGTPHPSISFSWDTEGLTTTQYNFLVYVKNDHCPIANRQTIAYTINVTQYPDVVSTLLSPTNCVRQAYVRYDLAHGYLPRLLTITQGTAVIRNYRDTTGTVIDSLPAGDYVAIVSANTQCPVNYNFHVADSGIIPLQPIDLSYCKGDTERPLQIAAIQPTAQIVWFNNNNDPLPLAPTPQTDATGTYNWYVMEYYKSCVSEKVKVSAVVHPLPQTEILSKPSTICYGDTIYLRASGGVQYTWSPEDKIFASADGRLYTWLIRPGLFTVHAFSEFGCTDSASVFYDNIQQCCMFTYPTAFTPNADGRNDGFHIGTYGNMMNYRLAIYNRWGQLVYLSVNPDERWDGTQFGTPCEMGTYYYYFKAQCLTGSTEYHEGDVMLIK